MNLSDPGGMESYHRRMNPAWYPQATQVPGQCFLEGSGLADRSGLAERCPLDDGNKQVSRLRSDCSLIPSTPSSPSTCFNETVASVAGQE